MIYGGMNKLANLYGTHAILDDEIEVTLIGLSVAEVGVLTPVFIFMYNNTGMVDTKAVNKFKIK